MIVRAIIMLMRAENRLVMLDATLQTSHTPTHQDHVDARRDGGREGNQKKNRLERHSPPPTPTNTFDFHTRTGRP